VFSLKNMIAKVHFFSTKSESESLFVSLYSMRTIAPVVFSSKHRSRDEISFAFLHKLNTPFLLTEAD
jgi:hypothetical protein